MPLPDSVRLPNEVLNSLDALVDLDTITLTNQNFLSSDEVALFDEKISKIQNPSIKMALKAIVTINVDGNLIEAKKIFDNAVKIDPTEPASWLHFSNYLWARGHASESYKLLLKSLDFIETTDLVVAVLNKATHARDLDTIAYCLSLLEKHNAVSKVDADRFSKTVSFYAESLKVDEALGIDSKKVSDTALGVFDLLGRNGFIVKAVMTCFSDPECVPFFIKVDAKDGKRYFDLNMEIADYLIDHDMMHEKVSFMVSEF